MNPLFRPYLTAYCISVRDSDGDDMAHKIKFINLPENLKRVTFVCRCRNRYLVILSGDEESPLERLEMLDDIFACYGIKKAETTMGVSGATRLGDGIDRCIVQSYWSEIVAEIEKTSVKHYDELGIYKLFVPWPGARAASEFMESYLAPLMSESGNDDELLETAICYVLADGDMNVAAERMFCHKNTIRYRVGKLQERLDPDSGEKVFFQNLSSAVKIYLLKKNS
jgi:sugar diacid utilization regulator